MDSPTTPRRTFSGGTTPALEPSPPSPKPREGRPAKWQAVTFYTTGTGYEKEVMNLIKSATALKVPITVYDYPPTGSWRGNLNYKSACILRAFEEFPEKDIVFIDADAVIVSKPILFDELSAKHEYDVSAHFFKYYPRSGDADELLSGTLWIQNNEPGRACVKRWNEIGLARPESRHQMCLKMAIAELQKEGTKIRVFRHPFAYTYIFDYYRAGHGVVPVIKHFQASRRFRPQVGYGANLLPKGGR